MTARLSVMMDGRMLIGRFSGVGRVVTSLVDEIAKDPETRVVVLCGRGGYPPWDGRRDIETVESDFGAEDRTAVRRLLWEETRLRGLIRRAGVDVYHATWNTGIPAWCPVPSVLTVHDLIPWHNPAAYFAGAAQRFCHRLAVRSSIRRATRVTTVSEHVRRQVLGMFRIRPEKVATVSNGVHMPKEPLPQPPATERPYVLYVGGHEKRKNVAALFAAMRSYWRKYDSPLDLRVTGDPRSLDSEALEVFQSTVSNGEIQFLGAPDDAGLSRQYAGASVAVMLSLDEGFGLPVLEAMAHGCPVVAAARGALPEVAGEAGVLVDPQDSDAVAEVVRRIVTDGGWRAELRSRGLQRARALEWSTSAAQMREVYELALRGAASEKWEQRPAARSGHIPVC